MEELLDQERSEIDYLTLEIQKTDGFYQIYYQGCIIRPDCDAEGIGLKVTSRWFVGGLSVQIANHLPERVREIVRDFPTYMFFYNRARSDEIPQELYERVRKELARHNKRLSNPSQHHRNTDEK